MKNRGDRRDGGSIGAANDNVAEPDIWWRPQKGSVLGPRNHIAAVRRRLKDAEARGIPPAEVGAAIVGRRYLLTQVSIAEELAALPKSKRAANDTEAKAYAEYQARLSTLEKKK